MYEVVNSVRPVRREPDCVLELVTEWQFDLLLLNEGRKHFKWTTKPPEENLKLSRWLLQDLFELRQLNSTESGASTEFGDFVSYLYIFLCFYVRLVDVTTVACFFSCCGLSESIESLAKCSKSCCYLFAMKSEGKKEKIGWPR